jgi:uncharacterized protein (DUF697 family)
MLSAKSLFDLVKELNLQAISQAAERPVRLVLSGDETLTKLLQQRLGPTPWVSILHDEAATHPGDLRIHVHHSADLKPAVRPPLLTLTLGGEFKYPLPDQLAVPDLSESTLQTQFAKALFKRAPDDLHLSLARHIPLLRDAYSKLLIETTATGNAMYVGSTALARSIPVLNIPLNVADSVVLTKNQLMMAYKLALAEGKEGKPLELIKEILSVLGGSYLFKETARGLVGLIPGWGSVAKLGVSYAGTWVIGQAVHLWARQGHTPTTKELNRFYQQALARGQANSKRLWGKLGSRRRNRTKRALLKRQERAKR